MPLTTTAVPLVRLTQLMKNLKTDYGLAFRTRLEAGSEVENEVWGSAQVEFLHPHLRKEKRS